MLHIWSIRFRLGRVVAEILFNLKMHLYEKAVKCVGWGREFSVCSLLGVMGSPCMLVVNYSFLYVLLWLYLSSSVLCFTLWPLFRTYTHTRTHREIHLLTFNNNADMSLINIFLQSIRTLLVHSLKTFSMLLFFLPFLQGHNYWGHSVFCHHFCQLISSQIHSSLIYLLANCCKEQATTEFSRFGDL